MPGATAATISPSLTYLVPIGTFVLGFLTSRFTMSKKEREDVAHIRFTASKELMERQEETFREYCKAIQAYVDGKDAEGSDHFLEIATTGERYLYQLKIAADAILGDRVGREARDNTLIPKIRDAVDRILPAHYTTLKEIADKNDFRFDGELRRADYQSVYTVVEKFGSGPEWEKG